MRRIKPGDIVIIATVLLSAVFGIFPWQAHGEKAVLYCDGEAVKEFDLDSDCNYVFESEYNNMIVIENGTVRIESADCPDKVCVHTKAISKSGQTICCLPNKVIIRIVGKSPETDVISG